MIWKEDIERNQWKEFYFVGTPKAPIPLYPISQELIIPKIFSFSLKSAGIRKIVSIQKMCCTFPMFSDFERERGRERNSEHVSTQCLSEEWFSDGTVTLSTKTVRSLSSTSSGDRREGLGWNSAIFVSSCSCDQTFPRDFQNRLPTHSLFPWVPAWIALCVKFRDKNDGREKKKKLDR